MSAAPAASVAGRIQGTLRADVLALAAYPVAHADGCVKLDAMECPYELPDVVRDDIARAVRDTPLNRYPAADLSEADRCEQPTTNRVLRTQRV